MIIVVASVRCHLICYMFVTDGPIGLVFNNKLPNFQTSLFIVLKRTSIVVHKKILIIYQHICTTKYILTVGSSSTRQCDPNYTWSDNSSQKS